MDAYDDLLRTKVHLTTLMGEVEHHDDCIVLRTPSNPGFYHGNLLLLPSTPRSIAPWLERFEEHFGGETRHRALAWNGPALEPDVAAEAAESGLGPDSGVALALDGSVRDPGAPDLDWSVRPLDVTTEWEAMVALSKACDPGEAEAGGYYREFKERIRASIRGMLERGEATWWGGFDGDRLIAQCGMVLCGDLARFQAVETHPDSRRRGACSALIAHVASDAQDRHGARRVLLEADDLGPAVDLYRRLGFAPDGTYHSLVRAGEARMVREEVSGEETEVDVLLRRAFEGPGEASLVRKLRGKTGVRGFVSVQSGAIDGYVLYSPVRVVDGENAWDAIALGPMAVRADRRGRGVGQDLMLRSLAAMRAHGHDVCFVLGHPWFYPKGGFEPAAAHGLGSTWDVPDDVFMVAELVPGAVGSRRGLVHYAEAFQDLP